MGRAEAPIDLAEGPLAEFAAGLRALRKAAGGPPYRTMARKAHYSASTLSIAASGRAVPSLLVTQAYVRVCGGDEREWTRRWHALDAALNGARGDGLNCGNGLRYAEVQSGEARSAEAQSAEAQSAEAQSAEAQSAEAQSAEAQRYDMTRKSDNGLQWRAAVEGGAAAPNDPPMDPAATPATATGSQPALADAPDLANRVPRPGARSMAPQALTHGGPRTMLPGDKIVAYGARTRAGDSRPSHSTSQHAAASAQTQDTRPDGIGAPWRAEATTRPPYRDSRYDATNVAADLRSGAAIPVGPVGVGVGLEAPDAQVSPTLEVSKGLRTQHAPARDATPRTVRQASRQTPRPPESDTGPRGGGGRPRHRVVRSHRRRVVLVGAIVVAVAGAVTVGGMLDRAPTHPLRRSTLPLLAPHATARMTPRTPQSAPAGTGALVGAAAVLTGPGCAPTASAAGSPHTTTGGDGWTEVGGGPAECGGHALASYTTPGTGTVQDSYTWRFRTATAAKCTLRLFVPDTNPSSASAHYDVYGVSNRLGGFTIVQAAHKAQWVEEGTWIAFNGVLQITLTDRGDYPGAHHHVTASTASASCR